ncbi:SapC family protein [Comamonadaceae bacterium G21597-S1]|nr:SapC family protein [Comamonadaceae bacterium G21597-S1]
MFEKIAPVNKDLHAKKRVKEITSFSFASKFHVAYVTLQEFTRAASIFPIVFLEDKQKDEFRPVVLLGLKPGVNVFVDADGKWQASYIPAVIRRYPFTLTPGGENGQFIVCIDEESSLVSETEGAAMFDDSGAPTQVIDNVKRYLSELQQMEVSTHEFCSFLAKHNMFTPLNLRVRETSGVKDIAGCYVINEERLNNLSDELFLEIKNKRYLPAVYAHLISLAQTERLVKLQEAGAAKTSAEEKAPALASESAPG